MDLFSLASQNVDSYPRRVPLCLGLYVQEKKCLMVYLGIFRREKKRHTELHRSVCSVFGFWSRHLTL